MTSQEGKKIRVVIVLLSRESKKGRKRNIYETSTGY